MSAVEELDPMGYTDEEFYRAKCTDLEAEASRLRRFRGAVREHIESLGHGTHHGTAKVIKELLEGLEREIT